MGLSTRLSWNNAQEMRLALQTVVTYSDTVPPAVEFGPRTAGEPLTLLSVVSPTREAPCCSSHTVVIGTIVANRRFSYQYSRCTVCGFTVRQVVKALPDPELVAQLREQLKTSFTRNPRGRVAVGHVEEQHWPRHGVGGGR